MATSSNIHRKRYSKAKEGDLIREDYGGYIKTYIKGSSADYRKDIGGGAAKQTQQASKDYSAELRKIAAEMIAAADPFRGQRAQYQKQLSDLYKDPSSITESASYKFRLQQGQQSLERSMAAKGLLGSGNLALELQRYGQEMASTEFDKEVARLGMLSGASPGSPAAGAQLGAGLLGQAAGEDFNRAGYSAYAESFAGGAPPQAAPGAQPTTISRNRSVSPTSVGGGIGSSSFDPFSPIAPAPGDTYNARNRAIIAGGTGGQGGASPGGVEQARATSGFTSYSPQTGPVGGGFGPSPGTGYFSSSGGGGQVFGGEGGGTDFQESGEAGITDFDADSGFSIWGEHF